MWWTSIFVVIGAILLIFLLGFMGRKSTTGYGVKPASKIPLSNRPPSPASLKRITSSTRMRRRRQAGGFYPLGYSGIYLPGEELIMEAIYLAEIAGYTDDQILEYGDFAGAEYSEDNYVNYSTDSNVSDNKLDITEPEATSFEPISDYSGDSYDSGGSDYDSGGDFGGDDD